MWGPYDWVCLEFLALWLVHTKPPAIHQLHFSFPPSTGSRGSFCSKVSAQVAILCSCLSIQSGGAVVCPVTSLLRWG